MKSKILPASMVVAFLALGGCATLPNGLAGYLPNGATAYTTSQVRTAEIVRLGTVVNVRLTEIQADGVQKSIGSGIGALVGALAGHQIGGGKGKTIATVAGGVGGAIGGNLVASRAYRQPGVIATVKLDDGETIASAQAADVQLAVGERVQVFGRGYSDSPFRILPLDASVGGAK